MIRPYVFVLLTWMIALWAETILLHRFTWVNINLFYAIPLVFILRWKGPETWFIAAVFGLTRDVFAATPFALFGMAAFLSSFISRQAAIKMFQESPLAIGAHYILFGFLTGVIGSFFLWLIKQINLFPLFFKSTLWVEVIPTAFITIPIYFLVKWVDVQFRISFAERKF